MTEQPMVQEIFTRGHFMILSPSDRVHTNYFPSHSSQRAREGDMFVFLIGARSGLVGGVSTSAMGIHMPDDWTRFTWRLSSRNRSESFYRIATGNEAGQRFNLHTEDVRHHLRTLILIRRPENFSEWTIRGISDYFFDDRFWEATIPDLQLDPGGSVICYLSGRPNPVDKQSHEITHGGFSLSTPVETHVEKLRSGIFQFPVYAIAHSQEPLPGMPIPGEPPDDPTGPPADQGAPHPPENLEVLDRGRRFLLLSWEAPSNSPNPVTAYLVYRDGVFVGSTASTVLEFRDEGLSPATEYEYFVRASSSGNLSSRSNKEIATTKIPPPKTPGQEHTRIYPATWGNVYGSDLQPITRISNLAHGHVLREGNARSLIGFNDAKIRTDLVAAEILEMSLRITVAHSIAGTGKFKYGTHSQTNDPGIWDVSFVILGHNVEEPPTEGQEIELPLSARDGERFQDGVARGIAIGPSPDPLSPDWAIRFQNYDEESPPKLVVRYRK